MNRRTFLTAVAASVPASAVPDADLVSLFDGKSLAGWTIQDGPDTAFYVEDGDIVIHERAGFPAWLRSNRQYENFDFRGEFFVKGWSDSGIYIHAPEHGRPMWNGMQVHLFHQHDEKPQPQSMGAIFPVVAPLAVNVKNQGEWNTFRILMDWPRLRVWTNDTLVQDLDVTSIPELHYRFRRGHIGFESLSYPLRFRNIRIRELPSTDNSVLLFGAPSDFSGKWYVSEGKPKVQLLDDVIHLEGLGHIATKEQYRDFELDLFIRHVKHHNSGILFRSSGQGLASRLHYEVQLHDVEGAHYPTGSLYSFKRSIYPKIEAETWFPMKIVAKGKSLLVRVNGDTVLEYADLENLDEGHIELQAHAAAMWTQFKQIRITKL
jgi:hypothetical protein